MVSRARLDEHQRRLTSTIIAWSTEEVKVREETEDYLERSAEIKVDMKALERLIERGRAEVLLKVHSEERYEKRQQHLAAFRHGTLCIKEHWQKPLLVLRGL